MSSTRQKLAYFGHHKTATKWVIRIIEQVCRETGMKHAQFHSPKTFGYDLGKTIEDMGLDFFSFTNANIDYVKLFLDDLRGFHVVRDPRDIVVSAYFSHLHSHSSKSWPELEGYRRKLEGLTRDEGIMFTLESVNTIEVDGVLLSLFDSMMNWDYALPNVMELRFEDMIANPYKTFLKVFKFLDILDDSEEALDLRIAPSTGGPKINLLKALGIVYRNDFEFLTRGRKPGEENVKSHMRKGVPGDWKNYFNDEHKRYFKEHYKGLLVKLGYVGNEDW